MVDVVVFWCVKFTKERRYNIQRKTKRDRVCIGEKGGEESVCYGSDIGYIIGYKNQTN